MNERIKELAEQTGLIPKTFGPVVQTRHMKKKEQDLEKFAELIVRECANIATINAHQWASPGTYVLKHFRVKE